jgi:hypothetical protein
MTDREFAALRTPPMDSTVTLHRYVEPVDGTSGLDT